jgi:hypothetical protein
MVTYSFGNRNFMQPMGRLSMHSKCLVFFLLSFGWVVGWVSGGGGAEEFFHFSSVPNMFPSSFQCVPNRTSL